MTRKYLVYSVLFYALGWFNYPAVAGHWDEIWRSTEPYDVISYVAVKSEVEAVFFFGNNAYAYDGSGFEDISGFPPHANSGDYDVNGALWIGSDYGIYKCQNPPFGSYVLEVPTTKTVVLSISKSGDFGLAVADGSEVYTFNGSEWTYVDPALDNLRYAEDVSALDGNYGAFIGNWDWGYIGVYNDGVFDTIDSPKKFWECSVRDEDDIWFTRYDEPIYHYNSGSWETVDFSVEGCFGDIDFSSPDNGWVKKYTSWFDGLATTYYECKMIHYNGAGWCIYPQGEGYYDCGYGEVKTTSSSCAFTCGERAVSEVEFSSAFEFKTYVSITPTSVGKIKAMFR